jgi:hypothetical protein
MNKAKITLPIPPLPISGFKPPDIPTSLIGFVGGQIRPCKMVFLRRHFEKDQAKRKADGPE